jgi:hypothetical protein
MENQEIITSVFDQLKIITDEVLFIREDVRKLTTKMETIEANMEWVEVKNGGDKRSKQSRNGLIQQAYDTMKPGGILDQRFTNCEKVIETAIQKHERGTNATNVLSRAGKKFDVWWRWGTRVVVVLIAIFIVYSYLNGEKITIQVPQTHLNSGG